MTIESLSEIPSNYSSTRKETAIYEIGMCDGKPLTIAVECVNGGGNVPRNAASIKNVVTKLNLEQELAIVALMAEKAFTALKAVNPGEIEIEFGVELGGEMGIPFLKSEGKANFNITLKWSK